MKVTFKCNTMSQAVKRPSVTPKPVRKPTKVGNMMTMMDKKSKMKKSDMMPMKAKKSIGYKKGS